MKEKKERVMISLMLDKDLHDRIKKLSFNRTKLITRLLKEYLEELDNRVDKN